MAQPLEEILPDIHQETIEELRDAFDLFDIRGTGKISVSELVDSMQSLGFDDKNLMLFEMIHGMEKEHARDHSEMGSEMGARRDDLVTFEEFALHLASSIRQDKENKDLQQIFALFDEDHTGRINIENLKRVAKEFGDTWSDAELLEMLDSAKNKEDDADDITGGTNMVSFEEFLDLMMGRQTDDKAAAEEDEEDEKEEYNFEEEKSHGRSGGRSQGRGRDF